MPSSNLLVAPTVLHLINQVHEPGGRILDVGPGWGKYATLIREYVDPTAKIVGIEAWQPYVKEHRLDKLYDPILVGDVLNMADALLASFPVVLMADVIEHLRLDDAMSLLDRIPGWVIISTPRDFFSNPASCPPPEKHVSHWTPAAFERMGRFDYLDPIMLQDLGGLIVRLKPMEK